MKKIFLSAACLVVCTAAAFVWSNNKSGPQIDLLAINAEALAENIKPFGDDCDTDDNGQCWLSDDGSYTCKATNPKKNGCAPCD